MTSKPASARLRQNSEENGRQIFAVFVEPGRPDYTVVLGGLTRKAKSEKIGCVPNAMAMTYES